MSDFMRGLSISVQICKIYEELIFLIHWDKDTSEEYFNHIEKLKTLIEEETEIYDELSLNQLNQIIQKLESEKIEEFDDIKNRYLSRILERKRKIDNNDQSDYSFSLNTAIIGKILLETLLKIDNSLALEINSTKDANSIYNLLLFHQTYKYTLIPSNEFLEQLALDFDFELSKIPQINFDTIRKNFGYSKEKFQEYLNELLVIIAKDIIQMMPKNDSNDIKDIYSSMFAINQLEVILSYLDKNSIFKLALYYKNNNILTNKHISNIFAKKLKK